MASHVDSQTPQVCTQKQLPVLPNEILLRIFELCSSEESTIQSLLCLNSSWATSIFRMHVKDRVLVITPKMSLRADQPLKFKMKTYDRKQNACNLPLLFLDHLSLDEDGLNEVSKKWKSVDSKWPLSEFAGIEIHIPPPPSVNLEKVYRTGGFPNRFGAMLQLWRHLQQLVHFLNQHSANLPKVSVLVLSDVQTSPLRSWHDADAWFPNLLSCEFGDKVSICAGDPNPTLNDLIVAGITDLDFALLSFVRLRCSNIEINIHFDVDEKDFVEDPLVLPLLDNVKPLPSGKGTSATLKATPSPAENTLHPSSRACHYLVTSWVEVMTPPDENLARLQASEGALAKRQGEEPEYTKKLDRIGHVLDNCPFILGNHPYALDLVSADMMSQWRELYG